MATKMSKETETMTRGFTMVTRRRKKRVTEKKIYKVYKPDKKRIGLLVGKKFARFNDFKAQYPKVDLKFKDGKVHLHGRVTQVNELIQKFDLICQKVSDFQLTHEIDPRIRGLMIGKGGKNFKEARQKVWDELGVKANVHLDKDDELLMQAATQEGLDMLSDFMGSVYEWAYEKAIGPIDRDEDKKPEEEIPIFYEDDFPVLGSTI